MPSLSEVFAAAQRSRDNKPTKDRTDSGNAHDFEPSISDCIKSRYDMIHGRDGVGKALPVAKRPSFDEAAAVTQTHVSPDSAPTAPTPPPSPHGPRGSSPEHSPGHGTPHGGEHLGEGHEDHPGLEAAKELSSDVIGEEVTEFASKVAGTAKSAASSLAGTLGHQKSRLSEATSENPLTSRFCNAIASHGKSFAGLLKDRKSRIEEENFKTRYGYVPGFTGHAGTLGGGSVQQHGAGGTNAVPNAPHEHAPRSGLNKVLTRTVGPGIANAVAPRGWGGDLGKQKNAQAVVSPLERLQEHASQAQLHQTGGLSSQGTGGGYHQGIHQDSQYQPPGALGKNPFGK